MRLIALNASKTVATILASSLVSSAAISAPVDQTFTTTQIKEDKAQASANGFTHGQKLGGTTRNFWAHVRSDRNTYFQIPNKQGESKPTRLAATWVQGTILEYQSGFTQGTIGFATQAAVYNQIALERGHGQLAGGVNRTLVDSDGDAVGQWSKLGLGNIQARISNTTLTIGRQNIYTPVLEVNAVLSLPSSFEGISLHSEELSNLSFDLGTFDRISPYTQQSLRRFGTEYGNPQATTGHVNIAGMTYTPSQALKAEWFASRVEDIWTQHFLGITHELGDPDNLSMNSSFSYYRTRDQGQARLGLIDNDTYSLGLSLQHQNHTLNVGWQQVGGNEPFDYLGETDAIHLANTLVTDFNGPNEKSLAFSYSVNMAPYGIPGLSLMAYTARGWGIDGTHYQGSGYDVRAMDGEKHTESGFIANYVIQSGPLRDTRFFFLYGTNRASENQADGTMTETRLVTTIPFDFL